MRYDMQQQSKSLGLVVRCRVCKRDYEVRGFSSVTLDCVCGEKLKVALPRRVVTR